MNDFLSNKYTVRIASLIILSVLATIVSIHIFSPPAIRAQWSNLTVYMLATLGVMALSTSYSLLCFNLIKDKIYLFASGWLLSAFIHITTIPSSGIISNIGESDIFGNIYLLALNISLICILWLFYHFHQNSELKSNNKNDERSSPEFCWQCKLLFGISILLLISGVASLFINSVYHSVFFIVSILFSLITLLIVYFSDEKYSVKASYSVTFGLLSFILLLMIEVSNTFNLISFTPDWVFSLYVITTFLFISSLAIRLNKQTKQSIHNTRYHLATGLPARIILTEKIHSLLQTPESTFSLLILQPENFNKIKKYVDETTLNNAMQLAIEKLCKVSTKNEVFLALTTKDEKAAYIDGNCIAFIINTTTAHQVETVVTALQKVVEEHFIINELSNNLTGVVGIAQCPTHTKNANTLINCALIALKNARATKQKWAYYPTSPKLEPANITADLSLAMDLKEAIEKNQLEIFHQPQLDLKMLRVCGSECLLKWHHKDKGIIDAQNIIPIAQDLGLMNALTLWTVKTSLFQHKEICDEGQYNHMVSINISPTDVLAHGFLAKLIDIVEDSQVPSEKIILELNDTAGIINNEDALAVMEQLSEIGITVSVDDFYSGYTRLANYKTLPFQELKIGGQFVEGLSGTARQKSITETTISMAKNLSIEVVAEGINSQWEQDTLIKFGCDIGQGDFYSPPISKTSYLAWLNAQVNGKVSDEHYGEFIPAKK